MNRVINNIACGHKFLFFSSVVASHAWSKFSKVLDSLVLSSISRLFKFPRSARNPIKCTDTRRGNSKSNNNYKLHKSAIGFQIILSALACRSVCVAIFSCTFVWFYHSAKNQYYNMMTLKSTLAFSDDFLQKVACMNVEYRR